MVALTPDAVPVFPESEQGMTAEQSRVSTDTQLVRALQLLGWFHHLISVVEFPSRSVSV